MTDEAGYVTRARNPFRMPYPAAEFYSTWFEHTVTRTPEQQRQTMLSRVGRWFGIAHDMLPDDTSRDDMIACVYGIRGWRIEGTVATTLDDGRRPAHGWLLTHPTDGIITYADKARDGDLGPDYVAPTGGAWGGRPRFWWAPDLAALLSEVVTSNPVRTPYPQARVTHALTAHAFRTAPADKQETAAWLLSLSGRDLAGFLRIHDGTDPSVQSG